MSYAIYKGIVILYKVAIPYKSGKYSYRNNIVFFRTCCFFVAIPYKSGKYSYKFLIYIKTHNDGYVAIPYKSGKYSYVVKTTTRVMPITGRNPL